MAFSPNGLTLAATDDNAVKLWNVADPAHPTVIATLTGHVRQVYYAAFSSDGQTVVTSSRDRTLKLWSLS